MRAPALLENWWVSAVMLLSVFEDVGLRLDFARTFVEEVQKDLAAAGRMCF